MEVYTTENLSEWKEVDPALVRFIREIPESRSGDTIPQVSIAFWFILGALIGLVPWILLKLISL